MQRIVRKKQADGTWLTIDMKDIKKGDVLQFWEDVLTPVKFLNDTMEVTASSDAKLSELTWSVEVEYNIIVDATLEKL